MPSQLSQLPLYVKPNLPGKLCIVNKTTFVNLHYIGNLSPSQHPLFFGSRTSRLYSIQGCSLRFPKTSYTHQACHFINLKSVRRLVVEWRCPKQLSLKPKLPPTQTNQKTVNIRLHLLQIRQPRLWAQKFAVCTLQPSVESTPI